MRRMPSFLLVLVMLTAACGSRPQGLSAPAGEQVERATGPGKEKTSGKGSDAANRGGSGGKEAGSEGSGGGGNGGDGSPPGQGSAGTGSGSGSPSGPSRGPSPAAPIPAGTYEYDTDGEMTLSGGQPRKMPRVTTLAVAGPSGNEQRSVRDLRDSEGIGQVTETRLRYLPDGIHLSYVKVTFNFPGGLSDVREFNVSPPELLAPTGGGPGFKRSFTMKGSGTTATVSIQALRWEIVKIGNSSIRSVVVKTAIEFSGAIQGRQDSTTWFWPKHLLALREEVRGNVQNGPIRARSEYVAVLRSPTP